MLHGANGAILMESTHPGLQIRLLQVNDAERLLEIRRENFDFSNRSSQNSMKFTLPWKNRRV